jgi:hypothetical protein
LLGIVLCTGVDGSVVALTHHGSLAWQVCVCERDTVLNNLKLPIPNFVKHVLFLFKLMRLVLQLNQSSSGAIWVQDKGCELICFWFLHQVNTNSPIFAGACISSALNSQVGILVAVSQRLDPWNPFHVAAKDIFFVYNIVSSCVEWYV